MKSKPKALKSHPSDASSCNSGSSSTLESGVAGGRGQNAGTEEVVPNVETYYSSHITTVCDSMNAEAKGTTTASFSTLSKAEKRRETNRISARRSRRRRREEIERLGEELRRLTAESEELTAEKGLLQQELQRERSWAAAGNHALIGAGFDSVTPPMTHNATPFQEQQLLQQRLLNLSSNGILNSGFFPRSFPQAISPYSQAASLAPNGLNGIQSLNGFPLNSPTLTGSLLRSHTPVETMLLALLQNNAAMQIGQQQQQVAAPAPVPSLNFGLPPQANNALLFSFQQQQSRDRMALALLQAMSQVPSSINPVVNQGHEQPPSIFSQPQATTRNDHVVAGDHAVNRTRICDNAMNPPDKGRTDADEDESTQDSNQADETTGSFEV